MATTDHTAEIHFPLAMGLLEEYLKLNPELTAEGVLAEFLRLGVVDASRFYEIVTSQREGIPLKSINGMDLADRSNCKLTAGYGSVNGQRTAFGWRIKVSNCVGDVRAILYHPLYKKTFEAHIPYEMVRTRRHITITDCKNGKRFGIWTKYIKEKV